MIAELGTGGALKVKINTELKKQGLKECTSVTDPAKAGLSGGPRGAPITSLVWVLRSLVWVLVLVLTQDILR